LRSFGFIDSDVRNISADILKDIKKEELIEFYKMMIKQPKITLRIVGNDDKKFDGSLNYEESLSKIRIIGNLN